MNTNFLIVPSFLGMGTLRHRMAQLHALRTPRRRQSAGICRSQQEWLLIRRQILRRLVRYFQTLKESGQASSLLKASL